MPGYWPLLAIVTPVFVLFALGALLPRVCRLTVETEAGLLRLYVNFFYPALILKSVLGNAALRDPANLFWPPLAGFGTIVLGFAAGYYAGRALGLHAGAGLRTFAFAVGIYNYGFIPIPLMESLYGREPLGVLLVQNMGCELALWSVGLLVLSGLSPREGWRRVLNPPLCTLVAALVVNLRGLHPARGGDAGRRSAGRVRHPVRPAALRRDAGALFSNTRGSSITGARRRSHACCGSPCCRWRSCCWRSSRPFHPS